MNAPDVPVFELVVASTPARLPAGMFTSKTLRGLLRAADGL